MCIRDRYLSANKQGHFNSSTPLTLAETASVFGEMLTFKSLLKNELIDGFRRFDFFTLKAEQYFPYIISEKMNLSISKALIPLSYAGILGGMTTLVGSSTNIIGAEVAKELGVEGINFFSVTIPGLAIAIPGIIFVIFVLPKLMPKRNKTSTSLSSDQNKFIAQIEIDAESDLIGQQSISGTFEALPEMQILLIQRGEHSISAYQSTKIQKDDIIVVSAERKVIESALIKYGSTSSHPQPVLPNCLQTS